MGILPLSKRFGEALSVMDCCTETDSTEDLMLWTEILDSRAPFELWNVEVSVEGLLGGEVECTCWGAMVCFTIDGVLKSATSSGFSASVGLSCKEKRQCQERVPPPSALLSDSMITVLKIQSLIWDLKNSIINLLYTEYSKCTCHF